MDHTVRHEHDILISRMLASHFQTGRRARARNELEYLFQHCYSRRLAYSEGPLCQALVLSYLEPAIAEDPPTAHPVVILYLELRNGLIYGMAARGNIERVLASLESIGDRLIEQPFDGECFPDVERELIDIIDADSPSYYPSTLHLFHHAPPLAQDEIMAADIIGISCRRVFDTIQKSCGYSGNTFDSDEVLPYFESQYLPSAKAITRFRNALDPETMQMIQQLCQGHTRKAAQLQVYNFFASGTATIRRNRMQAIAVLPWLAPLLTGLNLRQWSIERMQAPAFPSIREELAMPIKQILDAVDTGKPLFDTVASALGVARETVRWSRGRMLPEVDHFDCFQVDFLLHALSWIPAAKRPASSMEWVQFGEFVFDCIDILARFNITYTPGCVGKSPGRYSLHLVRQKSFSSILCRWVRESIGPDIASMASKLQRRYLGHNGMHAATDFLLRLRLSFHRACPSVNYDEIIEDPFNDQMVAWFETISLRHLLGISKAWHRAIVSPVDSCGLHRSEPAVSQHEQRQREQRLACWPPLLEKPFRYRDRQAIELTSAVELIEEGNLLAHCIGGYADRCLVGYTLLYSVRQMDGRRLSTVELQVHPDSLRVTVVAHYARHNTQPDLSSEAVVDALVQLLNQSSLAEELQARIAHWKLTRFGLAHIDMHQLRSLHSNIYDRRVEELAWECAFPTAPAPWIGKAGIAGCTD